MSSKTDVPALDRALDILESISVNGSMGYKTIVDELSLPPASVARILKSLCNREYLAKDVETSNYVLGKALGRLLAGGREKDRLVAFGQPVLRQMRDAIRQTAILFYWDGTVWECIAKESHEDSITMQSMG
ncbi:hypothetical protein BVX99_00650, partial [bacterium F16]